MRVIVADDHALIRKGMETILNYQPNIEVVATAAGGDEAYQLVGELEPDVLLMDVRMPPGESGLIAARKIHNAYPKTKVIMLTMFDDKEYLLHSIKTGASGYVLKNAPEEIIVEAINTVYNGGVYISKEMIPYLVDGYVNNLTESQDSYLNLSDREIEILILTAKGYGNKEIADQLFLSVKTVESHKNKVMMKLGIKTRAELVEYAVKKKLLEY